MLTENQTLLCAYYQSILMFNKEWFLNFFIEKFLNILLESINIQCINGDQPSIYTRIFIILFHLYYFINKFIMLPEMKR
jgi:hypothetical protein